MLRTGATQVLPGPRLLMLEAYEYLDILLRTAVAQSVGNVQMCCQYMSLHATCTLMCMMWRVSLQMVPENLRELIKFGTKVVIKKAH